MNFHALTSDNGQWTWWAADGDETAGRGESADDGESRDGGRNYDIAVELRDGGAPDDPGTAPHDPRDRRSHRTAELRASVERVDPERKTKEWTIADRDAEKRTAAVASDARLKSSAMHRTRPPSEILNWAERTIRTKHTLLSTVWHDEERNMLNGTLVVHPDANNPRDMRTFHYKAAHDELVTIGWADVAGDAIPGTDCRNLMLACDSPAEAIALTINLALEHYFARMDRFEIQLFRAKLAMRETNGGHLFRYLMDLRYDLLHWNAQLIPLKELRLGLQETFGDRIERSPLFAALKLRLERVQMLQDEYRDELDALLSLDEATINYRSNDIMKTLTVFTVMLTPLTALGAVWGMNFEHMPEIPWRWGYAFALSIMFGCVAGIYWYLRRQGWTGNILEMEQKEKRKRRRSAERAGRS